MKTNQLPRRGIIAALTIAALTTAALAQSEPPPHVITSHMTHETDTHWHHIQTLSNGSNRVHKVRKPRPPNPYISHRIIATNDLPVQVQYVYRVTRADQTIITNTVTRTKTPRERVKITLPNMPPMPEIQPRGKLDTLGHALKRSKEERAMQRIRTGIITHRQELADRFIFTFENKEKKVHLKKDMTPAFIARARKEIQKTIPVKITHKVMAARDPVIRRQVIGNTLHNTHCSGKTTTTPLKRIHSARVKSAPVDDPSNQTKPKGTNRNGKTKTR